MNKNITVRKFKVSNFFVGIFHGRFTFMNYLHFSIVAKTKPINEELFADYELFTVTFFLQLKQRCEESRKQIIEKSGLFHFDFNQQNS